MCVYLALKSSMCTFIFDDTTVHTYKVNIHVNSYLDAMSHGLDLDMGLYLKLLQVSGTCPLIGGRTARKPS